MTAKDNFQVITWIYSTFQPNPSILSQEPGPITLYQLGIASLCTEGIFQKDKN